MMLCPSLQKVRRAYVQFDPTIAEHMEAFKLLCLNVDEPIRQHKHLRFELEDGFVDVRSMMFHKVGSYHFNHPLSKFAQ